ncbi:hypothetical protein BTJ39_09910 [Izhakiella australiensis]|uniref:HTH luxR-type domain-containing protein n=1 Tax=Izhakiella australiensis TaxID=1926881 RepID=A0A1S8YMD1_9GAMM|nr:helix-turn-helix transcriptional regulator [Izhakiella australiensis]OON40200.1 hypothetical protein BTJ39_09910 [Izhakiella australiensis]
MLEITIKTDNNFYKKGLYETICQMFNENDFINIKENVHYEIKHHNDIKIFIYDNIAIIATDAYKGTAATTSDSFERYIFIKNDRSDNESVIIKNLFYDVTKKNGIFYPKDIGKIYNKKHSEIKSFHKLSLREKLIFVLTGKGLTNAQIARMLGCSEKSVYNYKKYLITKHYLRSKHHLYRFATCIIQNTLIQQYRCWVIYNINIVSKSPYHHD